MTSLRLPDLETIHALDLPNADPAAMVDARDRQRRDGQQGGDSGVAQAAAEVACLVALAAG